MGKTIKLSLNDPKSAFSINPNPQPMPEKESRLDRKKKKLKEMSQKTQRTRENKKLQDAVNAESLDDLALPLKKNTM